MAAAVGRLKGGIGVVEGAGEDGVVGVIMDGFESLLPGITLSKTSLHFRCPEQDLGRPIQDGSSPKNGLSK